MRIINYINNMSEKIAVTKDHIRPTEMQFLFRAQDTRTLAEIDVLLQRQEKLR